MDIISHTLTGIAVGTVIATISNGNWKQKGSVMLTGGFGGALPDFDAISLWSKFDATIGSFFGLEHTGKEIYFGKLWYSHHAAFHSIIAPIIIIIVSVILTSVIRRKFKLPGILEQLSQMKYLFMAFFFGFLFHLFEDMPTPSNIWGGVNLFYPSEKYIGGFGNIWWWNNYDLFLIIVGVIILNLLINLNPKYYRRIKIIASISVFTFGLSLAIFQIKSRPMNFNYTGHSRSFDKLEAESKHIQKEILGEKLFQIMTSIDNKIPFNF